MPQGPSRESEAHVAVDQRWQAVRASTEPGTGSNPLLSHFGSSGDSWLYCPLLVLMK